MRGRFSEVEGIPVISAVVEEPLPREDLLLYLGVSKEGVSSALVKEEGGAQYPVYYLSKSLIGAEIKYLVVNKVIPTLVASARRLQPYFQAHSIIVVTDLPLRTMLATPEHSGRFMKWSVELSEFNITYQPRLGVKGWALADFVANLSSDLVDDLTGTFSSKKWILHVDRSSRD